MREAKLLVGLFVSILTLQFINLSVLWFSTDLPSPADEVQEESTKTLSQEVSKWFNSLNSSSEPFMLLNNTQGFVCPPILGWEKRFERIKFLDGSSLTSYLARSLPASFVGSNETISVPVYPPLHLINATNHAPDVPVVFVHMSGIKKTDQRYVMLAMRTACKFNKRVFVASVGYNSSEEPDDYPSCVTPVYYILNSTNETASASPVEEALQRFTTVYKHMSGNHFLFEKFCFDRWFIFHDLLEKFNLEKALYLDSDVLLFANASLEAASFDSKCAALVSSNKKGYSGHSSLWTKSKASEFANFIQKNYEDDALRSNMESMWENYQNNFLEKGETVKGGISDMHLIKLFVQHPRNSQDVCILDDTYDHCRVFDNRKNSFYQDELGLPYTVFEDSSTNTTIFSRLRTLHFQGGSKELLNDCDF
jgi:hypothetical protein